MSFIERLGLCNRATMLAEYDVNIASVARNVVITITRPEVVGMIKCVPTYKEVIYNIKKSKLLICYYLVDKQHPKPL